METGMIISGKAILKNVAGFLFIDQALLGRSMDMAAGSPATVPAYGTIQTMELPLLFKSLQISVSWMLLRR